MSKQPEPMTEAEFMEIAARVESLSSTNHDAVRLVQERSRLLGALNHVHAQLRDEVLDYIDEVTAQG